MAISDAQIESIEETVASTLSDGIERTVTDGMTTQMFDPLRQVQALRELKKLQAEEAAETADNCFGVRICQGVSQF